MPITIYQGHHHSLAPADINIVIDVIRAFTVAHYAFIGGAKEILLAGTAEEAFALKETYPDYVLTGEEKGVGISGFDLDNSPKRMAMQGMADKRLIQKTTNGVTAALGALNAKLLFVTGFSNARTTAEHVKTLAAKDCVMNIVASHPSGDDDMACAEYIKDIIEGTNAVTSAETIERIKGSSVAEKFFDRCQPLFDPEDIAYCTKELTGDFVMKVKQEREVPTIERVMI
ncbi:2-phosphosulfolactate phosphatase [Bacillus sp. SN1]|uniref:2-phosphosulfolactate phosphatase n=1 Tax=Bacillus sp. SN1 TaxID=2055158 RepID=UPI000C21E8E0|nr:2-phosphosulfolactate phosphatase [Bacillus sp. SN1]PJH95026.1 2-phosphosulfolactate phosphatase [Bacillus sp. SN1]PSI05637.1 2-phosphosulfolactate phosphatase [Bacillus subtilis]